MKNDRAKYAAGLAAGVVIGLASGPAMQARSAPPRRDITAGTVRAHRFELVGQDGTSYGSLGVDGAGSPALNLYDKSLRARASLGLLPDGRSLLQLYGPDGMTSIHAQIDKESVPLLMIVDGKTRARADLGIRPVLGTSLQLSGEGGGGRALLYVAPGHETAQLALGGTKARATLAVSGDLPSLHMTGPEQRAQFALRIHGDGLPSLIMSDAKEKRRVLLGEEWNAPGPRLLLLDGDASRRFSLP